MAWDEAPTEAQQSTMRRWLSMLPLNREDVVASVDWLADHTNRRQFSDEMGRVRGLVNNNITVEKVFTNHIWNGWDWKTLADRYKPFDWRAYLKERE